MNETLPKLRIGPVEKIKDHFDGRNVEGIEFELRGETQVFYHAQIFKFSDDEFQFEVIPHYRKAHYGLVASQLIRARGDWVLELNPTQATDPFYYTMRENLHGAMWNEVRFLMAKHFGVIV